MVKHYENNWDYLMAELGLLDLALGREVLQARHNFAHDQREGFAGLFISEQEVDRLLGHAPEPQVEPPAKLLKAIDARRKEIERRKKASLKQDVYLALPRLAQLFGLTPFEEQTVLICLAPELDLKYEKLFAYLQDDITKKRPTIDLILKLLCTTPDEKLRGRSLLSPPATLFRSQILRSQETEEAFSLSRSLRLDERILKFLLAIDGLHQAQAHNIKLLSTKRKLRNLRWSKAIRTRLLGIASEHLRNNLSSGRKLIYHLYGPPGTGKKTLASSLCKELDVALIVIDLNSVLRGGQNFEETVRSLLREAILQPAAVFLENYDQALEKDDEGLFHQQTLARAIEDFSWLTFISTETHLKSTEHFKNHLFLSVELRKPSLRMRASLMKKMTKEATGGTELDTDWGELAAKFHLTPGQMEAAIATARNHAHLREGGQPTLTTRDLYKGCRAYSHQKMATLARKLTLRHTWDDITLPPDSMAQLRELCAQMKYRHKVYSEWAFERKVSLQKGICALFHGQSGTGKTMAVEIVARELRLAAYKIDLSTVVSKYVGETEKNLNAIFREAETANAILFFDEADAIFGKRTEVKDAHDRYANIEINYLLQRLEEFSGVVILATNLRKNIDNAFYRRMDFAIEFPFPDEAGRYLIWKQHFPATAPVADDVDFSFLAERITIPGGNIKNIVLNAAFLAAEQRGAIKMEHLIHATRREYEKIGRMCTEMEFAPYHALLRNT